ncbi:MAG: glutamate--cysteine ligase, partial [Ideonella sp.]
AALTTGAGQSFTDFVAEQSSQTRDHFLAQPLATEQAERWAAMARESLAEQARQEAAPHVSFEAFRQDYVSPHQLG